MRARTWVLTLAFPLLLPGPGLAQDARVPTVDAGAVATLIFQVPAPDGADSASYALAMEPGYRTFVPLDGRLARMGDVFVVPVTVATPGGLPAGRLVAGSLTLDIDGFETSRRDLVLEVRERRDVTFALEAEELTIAPDGVVGVPFRVLNRGNLPDTVHVDARMGDGWTVENPARLVLAPGDSAHGALRIVAPVTASPGERELVLVTARTAAADRTRTVNLVVVSPAGWLGGLAHVPSSVFVGQALGGTTPVIAVSGGGRIGPETRVRLDIRHADGLVDPALQRQTAGPRLRASVSRPGLDIEAGDVYGFETTLSGSLRQARGVQSAYDPEGPLSFRATAAFPTGFDGRIDGGHILQAEAGLDTRYGQAAVLAGDMLYPARGALGGTRSTGAGLRWSHAVGPHRGSAEATLVRFTAGEEVSRTGPALDLQYALSADRVNGRLRLRRVPDAATNPGGQGNELAGSFSARLSPLVNLVGWGYDVEQNLLAAESVSSSRAGNLGLRGRFGPVQLQLGASLSRRSSVAGADTLDFARRTVRFEGLYSRGILSLQADAEVGGSRELDRDGPYRAAGASLRLYGSDRWGWLRVQHSRRPGNVASTSLNAGGTAALGPVELSGGLTHTLAGGGATTSFWSGTEIQARRNLSIHVGASARPSLDASDWTVSLGVSRRLSLPLPVARHPDLHGVVFEDANGNGALDPGEDPVPGVTLGLGYLETESDHDGRFAFRDATGAALRVHTGGLPIGYVLSPRVALPTRGRAAVPLVRTATLTLDLFLDRDEDGARDPAESVGADVSVTITDQNGRQRTVTADGDGTARISGLLPGRYTVTARPTGPAAVSGENPEVLMEVELGPGAEARHTLAVPLRRRTIRMGGDAGAFEFLDR